MTNFRTYGKAPFHVVVIHGGPGAAGEMAPVARELESDFSVLEPLQTASTIRGQVEELNTTLEENGASNLILIGFSWGAWLSFIYASTYPRSIKKLMLIGSGGFEEKYAKKTHDTRLDRLDDKERKEIETAPFARLGELYSKADTFDPLPHEPESIDFNPDIFDKVWTEAAELRKTGKLLEFGNHIQCPVVAIHGDWDPHPAEGVKQPLVDILKDFRFILLKNCGHKPWIEKQAKDKFFEILRKELD